MSRITSAQSSFALPCGNTERSSKKLELTAWTSAGWATQFSAFSSTPSSRPWSLVPEKPVAP